MDLYSRVQVGTRVTKEIIVHCQVRGFMQRRFIGWASGSAQCLGFSTRSGMLMNELASEASFYSLFSTP
jgi:hypothetical protein